MAIVASSNATFEKNKSVFPWVSKHEFYTKHTQVDATQGVKKVHRNKGKKEVMEDVAIFCARNDNTQDVTHGAFNHTIDDDSSFIVTSWVRSMNRENLRKKHMLEKQDQSCSRSHFVKVSFFCTRVISNFLFHTGM